MSSYVTFYNQYNGPKLTLRSELQRVFNEDTPAEGRRQSQRLLSSGRGRYSESPTIQNKVLAKEFEENGNFRRRTGSEGPLRTPDSTECVGPTIR